MRKVVSPSAPIALRQEPALAKAMDDLQKYLTEPGKACISLTIASNWLRALVTRREKARAQESKAAWKKWTAQQCSEGGGGSLLFRFLKRTKEDPDMAVQYLGSWSTAAKDVLKADLESWSALWHKWSGIAEAPWRTLKFSDDGTGIPLAAITGKGLRKAARTFKPKTATGIDAVSPSTLRGSPTSCWSSWPSY